MDFTEKEIEEFNNEASEMLEEAEKNLLSLEKGANFQDCYGAIFRVFHSLKGGAGMFGMERLQNHTHELETNYQTLKEHNSLTRDVVTYLLDGIDVARQIIAGHEDAQMTTQFTPADAPPSVKETTKSAEVRNKNPALQSKIKVVIIDDEPDITFLLKSLLDEEGFEATEFNEPQKAIEQIKAIKPDIILTDFQMPGMTGHDVLDKVHAIDSDIPVVFLSGHLTKNIMIDALSYGVFNVLEKPYNEGQVISTCKIAGERHRISKLLDNTINFLYYQIPDLDEYMKKNGDPIIRENMMTQFRNLIEIKRKLKDNRKKIKK
jgi:FixJ family two-component response regulator/HPt (histidine-containing phosphotransfer) domain-containing protein